MSNLDDKIRQLATSDWQTFFQYFDKDIVITLKVRILRDEGQSWHQISNKLGVSVKQARTRCKKSAVQKGQANIPKTIT